MNISLSIDEQTVKRLDAIAQRMDRTRSWVATEAMEQYLNYHEWFVRSVEEALIEAQDPANFVSHEEVVRESEERIARLRSL